jgi:hypothetical protein
MAPAVTMAGDRPVRENFFVLLNRDRFFLLFLLLGQVGSVTSTVVLPHRTRLLCDCYFLFSLLFC